MRHQGLTLNNQIKNVAKPLLLKPDLSLKDLDVIHACITPFSQDGPVPLSQLQMTQNAVAGLELFKKTAHHSCLNSAVLATYEVFNRFETLIICGGFSPLWFSSIVFYRYFNCILLLRSSFQQFLSVPPSHLKMNATRLYSCCPYTLEHSAFLQKNLFSN